METGFTFKAETWTGTSQAACTCPECGEDMTPRPPKRCTCPNMIYIPPGQHIHVDCELHGRTKLYGSQVTW